jgi:phosphogluconate dehydratase
MGGPIAKVRDGDMILLDCASQTLKVEVDANEWAARSNVVAPSSAPSQEGNGRELFALFRQHALGAEEGASPLHILFGAEA